MLRWVECVFVCACEGLDASGYRNSSAAGAQEDGEEGGDQEAARDPFEGTEGLFVTCTNCHAHVEVMGSKVRSNF